VDAALSRLEAEGFAMRGAFSGVDAGVEWCERRLLARIHRLTIGRLRREIDPVSVADFMRFLLRWQHAAPGTQLHGRDGLSTIVAQLHGVELPAPAWERSVFPLRVKDYAPSLLDDLCFSGVAAWGRFSPPAAEPAGTSLRKRRTGPTRNAPLAVALREELPVLLDAAAVRESEVPRAADSIRSLRLTRAARDVLDVLTRHGASFLGDVARATGLLPSAAEEALWELVARGLVTGDGFAGLRTLLTPEEKRRPERRLRALRGGRASLRSLPIGRWALLRPRDAGAAEQTLDRARAPRNPRDPRWEQRLEQTAEAMARTLLRRYGVVLRELTTREALAPPWRHLLVALRRMEARGEVRGGRFVSGLVGEQFALPEAVEALRATRRLADDGEPILVAAADPLNLVGILTPGARIPATSGQVIAFQRGVPIESGELGAVRSRLQAHAQGA
jgi:ATP-dependent Lhr-like helicase